MTNRVSFTPSPVARGLLALTGLAVPVASFVALHEMHPAGRPERMTDSQLAEWAQSGAHTIWAGGVLQLAAALLLLVFAAGLDDRLRSWGAGPVRRRTGAGSFVVVSGLVALSAILQIMTGVIATPEEAQRSETLLPVLALLYGNLNVAVWCLLVPAVVVTAWAPRAPKWLRIVSGLLAVPLSLTLALPFMSWFPAFVWLGVIAAAVAIDR